MLQTQDCNPANHPFSDDYAIVIGINRYSGIGLRKLKSAESDAIDFAAWLEDPKGGGLCPSHIRLILSSQWSDEDFNRRPPPIQDDIDEALERFGLGDTAPIGRRFYFYFSGHGVGAGFDNIALLMANATYKKLNSNIGLSNYRQFFRDVGAFREMVFVLDCCRDGDGAYVAQDPTITNRPVGGHQPIDIQDFVLMGARNGGQSFEPIELQTGERRGLLSRALKEALKDRQAFDPSVGGITAEAIQKYVKGRVPKLAQQLGLEQEADYDPPVRSMFFGPVTPPQDYQVRVTVTNPAGGPVVLKNGAFVELSSSPAASFPQLLSLPGAGLYVLQQDGKEVEIDTRKIKVPPDGYNIP